MLENTKLFKTAPALASLLKTDAPTIEHLRACVLELARVVTHEEERKVSSAILLHNYKSFFKDEDAFNEFLNLLKVQNETLLVNDETLVASVSPCEEARRRYLTQIWKK